MYCSKCGKQINYNSTVCVECVSAIAEQAQERQQVVITPPVQEQTYQSAPQAEPQYTAQAYSQPGVVYPASSCTNQNSRKAGFGKALTSTIVASASIIFYYVSLIGLADLDTFGGVAVGFMGWLACSIVGLVLGIGSINTFKRVKREGLPAPIATLILGIVGLATAAIFLFILFVVFWVVVGLLGAL